MQKRLEEQASLVASTPKPDDPPLNGVSPDGVVPSKQSPVRDLVRGAAAPSSAEPAHVSPPEEKPVVERMLDQRWPYQSEPACVMCGRFAEFVQSIAFAFDAYRPDIFGRRYESSETGDGVCSIECKHAQLSGLSQRRGVVGMGAPASVGSPRRVSGHLANEPSPGRPSTKRALPQSYSTVSEVKHGKAVLAVAFGRTSSGQPKRPALYTVGEGLLRVWENASGSSCYQLSHHTCLWS